MLAKLSIIMAYFCPLHIFLYMITEFIMNVGSKNMSPKSINKLVSTHFLYLNNLKREAELICLTNGDILFFMITDSLQVFLNLIFNLGGGLLVLSDDVTNTNILNLHSVSIILIVL